MFCDVWRSRIWASKIHRKHKIQKKHWIKCVCGVRSHTAMLPSMIISRDRMATAELECKKQTYMHCNAQKWWAYLILDYVKQWINMKIHWIGFFLSLFHCIRSFLVLLFICSLTVSVRFVRRQQQQTTNADRRLDKHLNVHTRGLLHCLTWREISDS